MLHVAVLTHWISKGKLHFPGYCLQINSSEDSSSLWMQEKGTGVSGKALAMTMTWGDTQLGGTYNPLSFPALGHSLPDLALTAHHECVTSKSIDSANMFRYIRHTTGPPWPHGNKQEFNYPSLGQTCSRKTHSWIRNLSIFHYAQILHNIKTAFANRHIWKQVVCTSSPYIRTKV